jgi:peptidoglycan/xylan/chitin deacetylase (PgdA/CDA1 family)
MLGEMQSSDLVTLGAHTHTHRELVGQPGDTVREELARPIQLFEEQLGQRPWHFAYPRARFDERVEQFVQEYYDSAVVGGGRKATVTRFDPYRIPRVPVRASDGWLFFRLKVAGWLEAEESIYSALRGRRGRATP